MTAQRAVMLAALAAATLACGGCVSAIKTSNQADVAGAAADRLDLADATVDQWSNVSSLAAKALIDQYGVPDEVHYDRLVWNHSGPWERTVVRNEQAPYAADAETGVVEQTVPAAMTQKQAVDIAAFDDNVSYDARAGTLTSRSDSEEINFLRVNLARDVAAGRLDAVQARDSYASILSFEASGRVSPYLRGLRSEP
jgi:hypothetical protein